MQNVLLLSLLAAAASSATRTILHNRLYDPLGWTRGEQVKEGYLTFSVALKQQNLQLLDNVFDAVR
jgi:hypothetical protein